MNEFKGSTECISSKELLFSPKRWKPFVNKICKNKATSIYFEYYDIPDVDYNDKFTKEVCLKLMRLCEHNVQRLVLPFSRTILHVLFECNDDLDLFDISLIRNTQFENEQNESQSHHLLYSISNSDECKKMLKQYGFQDPRNNCLGGISPDNILVRSSIPNTSLALLKSFVTSIDDIENVRCVVLTLKPVNDEDEVEDNEDNKSKKDVVNYLRHKPSILIQLAEHISVVDSYTTHLAPVTIKNTDEQMEPYSLMFALEHGFSFVVSQSHICIILMILLYIMVWVSA